MQRSMFRTISVLIIAVATSSLAACGSSSPATSASEPQAGESTVASKVSVNSQARALLPASVRENNELVLGAAKIAGTSALPHTGVEGGKQVGLDLDIRAAVAAKLGITWKVETGTFQTIVPGTQNGKYQVGQSNFGVTEDRLAVVDFATYLNDGQAFVGSKAVGINKVGSLLDICGLNVATTTGTTFQKLLQLKVSECAAHGKKPYTIQYFADTAPIYLGLQNGKIDTFFGPTLSLKVLSTKIPGTKFLGEVSQTPVGFVVAKKSPIAPALVAAINALIADGTYQKIFAKWHVASSIITSSQLNPKPTY